jgi:anti-sigma factor RsiW
MRSGKNGAPDCAAYGELLSAYVDDELSPAEVADLGGHLKACQDCNRAMDELAMVRNILHHAEPFWPKAAPSSRFLPGVLDAIGPSVASRPAGRRFFPVMPRLWLSSRVAAFSAAALAALLLVVGGVNWVRQREEALIASSIPPEGSFTVARSVADDSLEEYIVEHALQSSDNLLIGNEDTAEFVGYEPARK